MEAYVTNSQRALHYAVFIYLFNEACGGSDI
jgi:hypothetical protein